MRVLLVRSYSMHGGKEKDERNCLGPSQRRDFEMRIQIGPGRQEHVGDHLGVASASMAVPFQRTSLRMRACTCASFRMVSAYLSMNTVCYDATPMGIPSS